MASHRAPELGGRSHSSANPRPPNPDQVRRASRATASAPPSDEALRYISKNRHGIAHKYRQVSIWVGPHNRRGDVGGPVALTPVRVCC